MVEKSSPDDYLLIIHRQIGRMMLLGVMPKAVFTTNLGEGIHLEIHR